MAQSFETLGFLSPDVDAFRSSVRTDHSAAFDNVERVAAMAITEAGAV